MVAATPVNSTSAASSVSSAMSCNDAPENAASGVPIVDPAAVPRRVVVPASFSNNPTTSQAAEFAPDRATKIPRQALVPPLGMTITVVEPFAPSSAVRTVALRRLSMRLQPAISTDYRRAPTFGLSCMQKLRAGRAWSPVSRLELSSPRRLQCLWFRRRSTRCRRLRCSGSYL